MPTSVSPDTNVQALPCHRSVFFNNRRDARLENRLPKYIVNAEEAETVLAQPDVRTIEGLRDRAILETFYSRACGGWRS